MKKKNHDRAVDKKNFSIALPLTLIAQLQSIANLETRSRNKQIQHFLELSVQRWNDQQQPANFPPPLSSVENIDQKQS